MNAARWLLRAAWALLAAVLVLQAVQFVSALRYVAGPDAFAVSPLLMAALAFKGVLAIANLGLLLAVQSGLRRMRPTGANADATPPSSTTGPSP